MAKKVTYAKLLPIWQPPEFLLEKEDEGGAVEKDENYEISMYLSMINNGCMGRTPHNCVTLTSTRVTNRIPLIADGASGAENVVDNRANRDSPPVIDRGWRPTKWSLKCVVSLGPPSLSSVISSLIRRRVQSCVGLGLVKVIV